jgi:Kef-type K+ transport system membrane component KefB
MNVVLAIGIIIIAGFFGGMLAHRLKFPRITGYLIVGILLSPSVTNIVGPSDVADLDVFTSMALGIIAFSIGGSLHWESLRRLEKSILWVGTAQGLAAFFVSVLAITFLAPLFMDISGASLVGVYLPMALVIGAMASATAPTAVLAIVREIKAKGSFTTTLLAVVAYDDAIAVVLFSVALGIAIPLAGSGDGISAYQALLLPVLKIMGSVAIGIVFGFVLAFIARQIKARALMLVVVLGTILLCVGVTQLLDFSEILANMVVGFVVLNKMKQDEAFAAIDDIEDLVFVLFFVLAGLHFDFGALKVAGLLAVLVVLSRFAGKYLGVWAGGAISGAPQAVRKYLGLALLPKAGVTIGLALLAERVFPSFGSIIFNAILASVVINELIAPLLVRFAITKAGERHADQSLD